MEVVLLIILAVVIGSFLGYLYFRDREDRKERSKMLNAILAKDHQEMANLEWIDKAKQEEPTPTLGDNYEDPDNLTDKEYIEMETNDVNENA